MLSRHVPPPTTGEPLRKRLRKKTSPVPRPAVLIGLGLPEEQADPARGRSVYLVTFPHPKQTHSSEVRFFSLFTTPGTEAWTPLAWLSVLLGFCFAAADRPVGEPPPTAWLTCFVSLGNHVSSVLSFLPVPHLPAPPPFPPVYS